MSLVYPRYFSGSRPTDASMPEEYRSLEVGVIVCGASLRNCSYNSVALRALCYPDDPNSMKNPSRLVGERLQALSARAFSSAGHALSGRRTYSWYRSNLLAGSAETSQLFLFFRGDIAPLVLLQACERFQLSRREQEIVHLLLRGKTSKEIASEIGISPNTVKTLFRILMAKMGVSTRSGILGKVLMTAAPVALASVL